MTALILLSDWQASQIEFWRKIPSYEGYYDVSSFGRVRAWYVGACRSHGGYAQWPTGFREEPKLLYPTKRKDGYYGIRFTAGPNKNKGWLVHRLVALAFLPNPNNLPMVNHITNVKADNRLPNLEWVDHAGNVKHVMDNRIRVGGSRSANAKIIEDDVVAIRRLWIRGWSLTQLGVEFNLSFQQVSRIVRGDNWSHVKDGG